MLRIDIRDVILGSAFLQPATALRGPKSPRARAAVFAIIPLSCESRGDPKSALTTSKRDKERVIQADFNRRFYADNHDAPWI